MEEPRAVHDRGCRPAAEQGSALLRLTASAAIVAAVSFAAPAFAQPTAAFYKGKTITIVVGHQGGTGFDIYSRALARHMGRHIPGQPSMIVQNMPGASGIAAANWLNNIAPKDGTALANFVHTVTLEPLFGQGAAKFEPTKFTWIGNIEKSVATCVVTRQSGINTFDDIRAKETLFGATGGTGPLTQFSLAIKNLLGAKVRLVSGYRGAASIGIAMQRGEVHAMCGATTSFLKSFWADQIGSGEFKPIIQLNGPKLPQLKGIAHAYDLVKSDSDRQVFDLIFGALSMGRIFAGPPSVPADRAALLRKAFDATMTDKDFLADAEKTKIEVTPMTGDELAALVAKYSTYSKDVVERAKKAISQQ
jgi:tripartite-type tricarboxylate transporter receptor subunit TctC